jgi:TetR/AcrR family transcriptional regulator, ethionamide resistance regulator
MPAPPRAATTATRGSGRRRAQSRGDVREAAILACAWELLATKTIGEITIGELAVGANISRPTFYFYFDSLDAVVRALAEKVTEDLLETAMASIDDSSDGPAAVLHRIASAYMRRWRLEGPVLRAMVPLGESDPGHRAFWNEITGRIADSFARSIEADRRSGLALPGPPSARDLAVTLMSMMWRCGYDLSLSPPSDEADARVADTLTAVCLRAIYGDSPPAPPGDSPRTEVLHPHPEGAGDAAPAADPMPSALPRR